MYISWFTSLEVQYTLFSIISIPQTPYGKIGGFQYLSVIIYSRNEVRHFLVYVLITKNLTFNASNPIVKSVVSSNFTSRFFQFQVKYLNRLFVTGNKKYVVSIERAYYIFT